MAGWYCFSGLVQRGEAPQRYCDLAEWSEELDLIFGFVWFQH